jgi:glycosyltransferase involved in cell wall biosynthesis
VSASKLAIDNSVKQLAIIIPVFKPDFLAKALSCLSQQTDPRFNIYIGDDASPADIQSIAKSTLKGRSYIYRRFENNLGGKSLPQQWNRCVDLSNEPWVWLFGDDDTMDENCVEAFYKLLEKEKPAADILRFDSWIINESDKVIGLHTLHPDEESWLEFAYGHLMGWRRSFMQQLIFRRSAFEATGGFVDFPLAWSTDDAAVIAMGRKNKIRRIPNARVYWRSSGKNITPDKSLQKRKIKLRAVCLFLEWLEKQLQAPREHMFENDDAAFASAMDKFLVEQIMIEGARPALANWSLLKRTRHQICRGSQFSLLKYIIVAGANDFISFLGKLIKGQK